MTGNRGSARSNAVFAAAVALLATGAQLALVTTTAIAANPPLAIQAELDQHEITLSDAATLTVTVTAEGMNVPSFQLPAIQGAQVERLGESQGFSWVNGTVTKSSTVAFRIHPTGLGDIHIPAIHVAGNGVEVKSAPLVLHVAGSSSSSDIKHGSSDLFVRLTLDKRRAYWNEGVTARFTVYSRAHIEGAPVWDPPDAPGFWSEVLGPVRTGRVVIGGVEYDASELRVAYFPTRTGRLSIGPGHAHLQIVREIQQPDPWSMLGMPETQAEDVTLDTDKAYLDVDPLPAGAPAGFRGGVGQYAMDVRVDRMTVHAGEAVTVATIIRGQGNLASTGDPDVEASARARIYAADANTTVDRSGTRVRGERRREVTLIPEAPGRFAVLPVRFAWFDPEASRYKVQVSDTIAIRVLPPTGGVGDSMRASQETGPLAALRAKTGIHLGPLTMDSPGGARALALASVLAYAGVLTGRRLRDRAERNPRRRRQRGLERLLLELEGLRGSGIREQHAANRIATTLLEALALRFDADLEGRNAKEALEHAREAGAPESDVTEIAGLLSALDRVAFAPPSPDDPKGERERVAAERLLRRYREELV